MVVVSIGLGVPVPCLDIWVESIRSQVEVQVTPAELVVQVEVVVVVEVKAVAETVTSGHFCHGKYFYLLLYYILLCVNCKDCFFQTQIRLGLSDVGLYSLSSILLCFLAFELNRLIHFVLRFGL